MKYRNILIPILVLSTTFACNKKENGSGLETGQNNSDTFNSRLKQINQVAGIGKIEPETKILSLASERGGIIKEIFKSNGDKVKPGETIITLDSDEEQSNMELLKARIKTQENQIELDRYSVKEAELKLDNKKRLLESARKLLKNGAETSQNIDDLETEVKLLETGLLKNKTSLEISESKLSELKVELRLSMIELSRRSLTAPVEGTVLNILVTLGSSINQYAEFCEFAPDGKVIARCEIDEMFADRIREGQDATITLVGGNEVIATGKVVRAAPFLKRKSLFSELPGDMEDRRIREVWILLDNNTDLLFNLQVECIITI